MRKWLVNYFLPQHLHFIHLNNVKQYVPNCLLFGYFRLCHSILQFSSDNFIAISFIINLNLELFWNYSTLKSCILGVIFFINFHSRDKIVEIRQFRKYSCFFFLKKIHVLLRFFHKKNFGQSSLRLLNEKKNRKNSHAC